MILSKTFYNSNTIKIKLMNLAGITTLLFVLRTKKILLKIKLMGIVKIRQNSLILLNKKITYNDYHNLLDTLGHYLKNNDLYYYSNFIKLHLVGLGFKNFILNDELYVLVGDCNYIIFKIPCNLKVYCKKNQIYVLGNSLTDI